MALTVLAAALLPTVPAVAFPNDVMAGCHWYRNIDEFRFVGTWPSSARTAVRTGILQWNGALDYTGQPLVTVREDSVPAPTEVSRADMGPGILGRANCVFNTVQISSRSEYQSSALLTTIGRHEFGHILALHHTGKSDSFNGDNPPTMATCLTLDEFESATNKSQDDIGSLTFSHSHIEDSPMMANFGLEQGFSYFGKTAGTVTYLTADGATGPGHVRFKPTNPGTDYVYQTMAWADAPSKRLVGVINHKTNTLTDDGTVKVELWARSVTYGTSSSCDLANWPNGKNMNERTAGSFIRRRTATMGESPVWVIHRTSDWVSLSSGDHDVQVRAFADMKTASGSATSIRFDNVRTQCFASQSEGDCL